MYLRLEFSRGREMMYLSHLDLMRTFGRAIRRAGIPICYTSGFNPHAQMVFGLPLQVGVTGAAEYLDINIDGGAESGGINVSGGMDIGGGIDASGGINVSGGMDAGEAMHRLNKKLPAGLHVSAAREKRSKENVMSIITHATYEMRIGRRDAGACLEKAVADFLMPGPRIVNTYKAPAAGKGDGRRANAGDGVSAGVGVGTGDGAVAVGRSTAGKPVKTMDIAPLVRSIEARGDTLAMTVTAGSVNNVKPDLVLEALNAIHPGGFVRLSLHRAALLTERGGILRSPIDGIFCYHDGA
ncbi:MAG: TIGR03936 family radical SAM-associated protein [Oscillospiraceae bacterium]|nr:TIGR03936 family radical SAM-associated protein [Oscillospiraceae bacterium]